MSKYSLKTQLLSSILSVLILGMGLLFYFSYTNLQTKVNKSQHGLYSEKIDNIMFFIEQKNKTLQKTGMVSAYEDSFKVGTLKILRDVFYKNRLDDFPFVINAVVIGVIFTWFYNPRYGALTLVLGFFGLDPIAFLADENLATYGIIIASFFPGIAYTMILYITGLTGVNREMIEAGRIDGASGFTMLWHVVLPQLKPATLIAVVVTIVGALRSFDLIAVMTAGGPWGSSEVLAYKMYQESLFNYRMGYGAAIATILFLIMDIYIAWFLYRLFKSEKTEK